MRQVLQTYRTGQLSVADVPAPGLEPGSVLVLTTRSLISVGTERQVMDLAKRSLVGKARARPDLVKKVLERLSRDGLLATGRAVLSRLDQPVRLQGPRRRSRRPKGHLGPRARSECSGEPPRGCPRRRLGADRWPWRGRRSHLRGDQLQ